MSKPTLYSRLSEIHATIAHWQSDLLVVDTPEVRKVMQEFEDLKFSTYSHDGILWLEFPFAYEPYFERSLKD